MSLAAFVPGFVHLGPLRIPVFGLIATAGLLVALFVSEPAAKRAGLRPQAIWDAGITAALAAFLASRVLLVVTHPQAFLQHPLFVLAFPSLTGVGMLLAAIVTAVYLHLHWIPWRSALDAWSPSASVLAVALALAHFVEGTAAGMPSQLPWAFRTPGDTMLGPVHPVGLYAVATAAILGVITWRLLQRWRATPGRVAALTLTVGGVLSFAVDALRQPAETFGGTLLDPTQYTALLAILAGTAIYVFPVKPALGSMHAAAQVGDEPRRTSFPEPMNHAL